MPFTVATAISRLSDGPVSCFKPGLTDPQKLQRVNEVLDRFYEIGTWRGVTDTLTLTSSGGIITLSSSYLRLDALAIPATATDVPIKSQRWAFSSAGPHNQDWSLYGQLVAIDLGDTNGQRRYQLTGNTDNLDALTFTGLARKRFTWITDTSTNVIPDSYNALRLGVLALSAEDENATNQYGTQWERAMAILNGNLEEFEPLERQLVVNNENAFGAFSSPY